MPKLSSTDESNSDFSPFPLVCIVQSGASLHMKDLDGCTPLALLSEDRKHFKSDPSEP